MVETLTIISLYRLILVVGNNIEEYVRLNNVNYIYSAN